MVRIYVLREGDVMNSVRQTAFGFLLGLFCVSPFTAAQTTISARPGIINYIEGKVFIGDKLVDPKQVNKRILAENEVMRTEGGKAEVLLTPGVFFRIGPDSQVTMLSPSLTNTRMSLNRGDALVEVAQLYKENDIQINVADVNTKLLKTGLYRFDADNPAVSVIDGKARVLAEAKPIDVKKGRTLAFQTLMASSKPQKFDRKKEDDLYTWSKLRSEYSSQASFAASSGLMNSGFNGWGGLGWRGGGWFYNQAFNSYGFVPANSYFNSPFGWGFYSPGYLPYAPYYGGGPWIGGVRPYAGGRPGWNGGGRLGGAGRPGGPPSAGAPGARPGGPGVAPGPRPSMAGPRPAGPSMGLGSSGRAPISRGSSPR